MARFKGVDIRFLDNQKIILGSNDDHEIYWDGTALVGVILASSIKSGINQTDAGAAAGELYVDTNDDNTLKRGV